MIICSMILSILSITECLNYTPTVIINTIASSLSLLSYLFRVMMYGIKNTNRICVYLNICSI